MIGLFHGAGPGRRVEVNGERLGPEVLGQLDYTLGARVADGSYWYDRACGAWGAEGGPTVGFTLPGLPLGGPLRPDASAGTTGVFINGRELHTLDVLQLASLGPVYPGRYWLDAHGSLGREGGPALVNLRVLAQQRAAVGGGGPWSHTTKDHGSGSMSVGGDGQGFTYFSSRDVSWSSG